MTIIQWNCNGLFLHLREIQSIVAKHKPQLLCLQETHLKQKHNPNINGYTTYRKDRPNERHGSGGVTIFTRNSNHSKEINLQTNLEAIAVQIYKPTKITVCNIYIPPPPYLITNEEIEDLLRQLPKPYIIVGDMNAHNTIWGSEKNDRRGRLLEDAFDKLALLNNGSTTYYCARTGNFSAIDLSFCDPHIASELTWDTIQCLYSSDHLPIKITHIQDTTEDYVPKEKWNLPNANWDLFTNYIKLNIPKIASDHNINDMVDSITQLITKAATTAIGTKNTKITKHTTPWWNKECEEAIKAQKRALYKHRRHKTKENDTELKRSRALSRYI